MIDYNLPTLFNIITAYISNAVDPYNGQMLVPSVESETYPTDNITDCFDENVQQSFEFPVENPDKILHETLEIVSRIKYCFF